MHCLGASRRPATNSRPFSGLVASSGHDRVAARVFLSSSSRFEGHGGMGGRFRRPVLSEQHHGGVHVRVGNAAAAASTAATPGTGPHPQRGASGLGARRSAATARGGRGEVRGRGPLGGQQTMCPRHHPYSAARLSLGIGAQQRLDRRARRVQGPRA